MRAIVLLSAVAAITAGLAQDAGAEEKIRLAQTSAATNCMMTCNSQAATCQTTCVVPTPSTAPPSPSSATPPALNAGGSTVCLMNCSTIQLTCQTNSEQGI